MAGSFECFEANIAEFEDGAVGEWSEAVLSLRFGTEIDGSTDAIAKFEVAGDKVGMKMS